MSADINYQKIYDKYHDGDAISDLELISGIHFFKDLEQKLGILGPTFHLAWKEVLDIVIGLDGYLKARLEK